MPYQDKQTQLDAQKKHYRENKARYMENLYARRKRNNDYVFAVKVKSKCLKCSENHPACLEFHHRDSNDKDRNVSQAIVDAVSLKRLQAEIDKCDILCSNCHAKEHWVEPENKYYAN